MGPTTVSVVVVESRERLTRARVLTAAVEIADAEGLEKLSMRNLAAHLGFEVMSLYNHVANKDDLLAGMADMVATEIERVEVDGTDAEGWKTALRHHLLDTKAAFERHRWVVMLWVTTMPGPARFDHMEWMLSTLAASGLSEHRTHVGFHALTNHVVGFMLQNVSMSVGEGDADAIAADVMNALDPERYEHSIRHIGQHIDGDHGSSFEFVLDLLLEGIAVER